jgi:hypothetical protein
VSFAAKTPCVASQQVFTFVVYFVTDSVRKLLNTPTYYVNGKMKVRWTGYVAHVGGKFIKTLVGMSEKNTLWKQAWMEVSH